jgi:two-component system sensor histidine kinase/response regulator
MKRDRNLSPQSLEHLEIINRSGEHLLATINDILEMSKIEAGRTVFVPTTFDLHALIYDLERMFRLRTDSKNLRFLVEKVGHIPQWVKTDEGKLRQVLINLMGNAVKFTEEGGIVLRLGGIVENAAAVNIQFEVEDTGPGMTEGEIGRLFQAFEQTTSGIKSGGTGLGLALSQGFVQIMGGTISVISTVGKGSIFRFKLPVQEDSEENAAKKEAKQRVLCLKPGQNEIRILIADDRETNRQLLLQMLKVVGFATQYAVNGKEAVQMVQKWKPQVVLMDMAMPVMDGYEATRKIKASPNSRNTAIVAVTASAFEEDKKRILAAGADDYLSKPFKDAELFEIIGRLTGAEYLYEETSALKVSDTADDKVLMCKTVAALPPDLVNQMRAAVESADIDQLNDLVLQLAKGQPLLAKQIQEMAARYEYEALTEIFSPGG